MGRRTLARRLRDRGLLLQALLQVTRLRLALAVLPFRRVLARVESTSPAGRGGAVDPVEVRRRTRAVERTSRIVPGARCLAQALAGKVLLARAGVPSTLRIGVAREPGRELEAHAWLVVEGRVVLGGDESNRFTPFPKLPDEGP